MSGRVQQRSERAGGPSLAPDDLAHVSFSDFQFNHVIVELFDEDFIGRVDQLFRDQLDERTNISRRLSHKFSLWKRDLNSEIRGRILSGGSRLGGWGLCVQLVHPLRHLRALRNPIIHALALQFNAGRIGAGIVRSHHFHRAAIARPRTTAEVSRICCLASEHGVPLVPSGGRTGLAAGAVAARGELVVSMERMLRMDPVDVLGATGGMPVLQ